MIGKENQAEFHGPTYTIHKSIDRKTLRYFIRLN